MPELFIVDKQRALPTVTKVESGTSQSKSGTSVNLSHSGDLGGTAEGEDAPGRERGAVRVRGRRPVQRVPHLSSQRG